MKTTTNNDLSYILQLDQIRKSDIKKLSMSQIKRLLVSLHKGTSYLVEEMAKRDV